MLMLTINGSWTQFSQPLTDLVPFRTHGNLRGVVGPVSHTARLPRPWASLYRTANDMVGVSYTVLSYDTPIAWLVRDAMFDTWFFPGVRYSVTTSKAQGRIATALSVMAKENPDHIDIVDSILSVVTP